MSEDAMGLRQRDLLMEMREADGSRTLSSGKSI